MSSSVNVMIQEQVLSAKLTVILLYIYNTYWSYYIAASSKIIAVSELPPPLEGRFPKQLQLMTMNIFCVKLQPLKYRYN